MPNSRQRKFMKRIAPLVLCIALIGCSVPSLNPLYTEKELVFDPALVGVWVDGAQTWSFEKAGDKSYDKSYKLLHNDGKGPTGTFDAHLVKLKDYLFLDISVMDLGAKDESRDGLVTRTLIPGHLFLRVTESGPMLKLAWMHRRWREAELEGNPKAIAHIKNGNQTSRTAPPPTIVLTAPTEELQEFVIKYADDKKAFPETTRLTRKEMPGAESKSGDAQNISGEKK